MSDKRKLIYVVITLIVFLAASVFFWLGFNHWYLKALPIAIFALIELGARVRKAIIEIHSEPTIDQEPEAVEPSDLITSISTLLLKDFITVCVDNDLSVLGRGTDKQRQNAFEGIISQYYEVRKDEGIITYLKLMRQKGVLELRKVVVEINADILKDRYSIEAAKHLNRLYPIYKFSKETYLKDLEMVGKSEIRNGIELDRIEKQLAARAEKEGSDTTMTPLQKRASFEFKIAEIEKLEGVGKDLYNKPLMSYAIYENRLQAEYEHRQKQLKNGR